MKAKKHYVVGLLGLGMLIYGGMLPYFLDRMTAFMIIQINESIIDRDSGQLLITSFMYVAKYTVIFFFIYFGAFLFSRVFCQRVEMLRYLGCFIILTTSSMFLFNGLHHENLTFQTHFLTLGLLLLLQVYIPKQKYYYFIFSIILLLLIISMQWLQLIPALSSFGFGLNDMAASIKMADAYFTDNSLFNTIATIFFAAFLVIAIIFTLLIFLQRKQMDTLKRYELQEEELKETKIALVESKVYEEMTTLVHDLKTPLVTVEGLISLIEMQMKTSPDGMWRNYFNRINQSVNKMKDMISEIMHENTKKATPVSELLEYVVSHLNLDDQAIKLEVFMVENVPILYVNKIRFSRAIANLLENAVCSFTGSGGFIRINVKRDKGQVLIQIEDNGSGIRQDDLQHIWKDGFSTTNSTGIGLSFVKRVIENHGGTITVNSRPNLLTQMNIRMPEEVSESQVSV
ncbi:MULTISPECIES: HAMP domain-containing sensor histidine kinase [unclassified Virgibacillus]|uniref:sensor histidine kinase n=1 Tax=unclassified Virgibacillus TaxID=2620237 RepID=UPI0024DE6E93|nr:HAMP domain-containing sensor histidine kinase [Virgibacillus sp. LDC-1]